MKEWKREEERERGREEVVTFLELIKICFNTAHTETQNGDKS